MTTNPNTSFLTRRSFLHGTTLGAGTALLAPMLQRLEAESAGAPAPRRFVFVIEGNGVNPEQVQPKTIARKRNGQSQNDADGLVDLPLAEHELPRALEPLAEFKDRLTIIQGLSGRVCGGGHSNNFGALGCYSSKKNAAGETIDCALAKAVPSLFPRVGLGISDRAEHSIIYNISAWGPEKAAPIQCRPDLAYNELFGSVAQGAGREDFAARGNLLDFMVDDVKRLERTLPATERERLGSYLGAFESMKDRHSRLNEIQNTLRAKAPVVTDKFRSEVETDRLDAGFDIGAAALIGGLTNVLVLASGCGDPFFSVRFHGLGIPLDKHSIGHGKEHNGRPWDELATTIRRFHFEQMARLAKKLQAVPEGRGTMLDNTVIVYLSDGAEGHHSRCWEWPMVVLGNCGGRLKTAGRYLNYPRYGHAAHRTTANFYLTLLAAAGVRRDTFGLSDPNLKDLTLKGPLPELLA